MSLLAGNWTPKSPTSCCTCTHVAGLDFPAPDSCLTSMLLPLEIHRCSRTQSWLQCPWPHRWSPSAALGVWRWADGFCCGSGSSIMGLLGTHCLCASEELLSHTWHSLCSHLDFLCEIEWKFCLSKGWMGIHNPDYFFLMLHQKVSQSTFLSLEPTQWKFYSVHKLFLNVWNFIRGLQL